ncbi:MAG: RIP metalloprotease RseP [Minisyncoccia bacterium]
MLYIIVILGLAVLVFIHEFGHFLTAKLLGMGVEEFGVGFPPRLFGWRRYKGEKEILVSEEKETEIILEEGTEIITERIKDVDKLVPVKFWRFFWGRERLEEKTNGFSGGTIYSVNTLPFGGFVRLEGEDKPEGGFNDELAWKKSIVVTAGVLMNLILGWIFLSLVFMSGVPRHLVISDVVSGSPAASAGLKIGDVIKNVSSGNLNLTDPISAEDFSRFVKSNISAVNVDIERGSEKINAELVPRANPPEGQGPLGVGITEMGFEPQPFFGSFVSGFSATWETIKMVLEGLGSFAVQLFTAPGAIQNVAGPVGIVFIAAQATSLGFVYLVQLLALISINLAILNLLPFPALDGGRFLFVLIEKIAGRPVSRKAQGWLNGAGFMILILLMVFITVKDIYRFF